MTLEWQIGTGAVVIALILLVLFWPKRKPKHDPLLVRAEDTVRSLNELITLIDDVQTHGNQMTPEIWGKITCLRVHGGLLERWLISGK